ncbi:putative leucine-rich repeat-containing protein DDB_G0290503 [Ruditapes philippinarum]|uniref:putative leucine-rich repeat-containing protein DDB_G0290503 n=1 Tax=Ruditapes philippinarum TaxID=129788 RepID=UPI00295B52BC|nr:putative leucine-rich repeat-containing protein DDB_G0290503 [Ruditapes philippinarum]
MMQNHREPFFKPLNADHHTFELTSGKAQSKNRQVQNSNEFTRPDQDLALNGERLNSLHAKLHQEADRIRKWKNQTELDMKQKDRKIQESSHTIDSLRKSILDIQLQNESLSMTLQEEISNREDILQKVSATRNLCSVLKDHLAKTESKVAECEAEKTEVKYLEQEHKRQFENLSEKFKELKVARDEEQRQLTSQISVLSKEKECLEQNLTHCNQEAESKIKILNQQLDDKNIEIRDIRAQVQKNNEKIHSLNKTVDSLTQNVETGKDELNNAKTKHGDLNKQLESLQIEKDSLEQKLSESKEDVKQFTNKCSGLQTELSSAKQEHCQQVQTLKSELEKHKEQLNQKHIKLQFLQNDFDKASTMLEEVKSSKDILIMEKTELQNRVVELEKQNAELLARHEENCITITQLTETVQEVQGQLYTSQQEGAHLLLQLNEIRAQLTLVETEKSQLDEKMKVIESDMVYKKAGMTDLQNELLEKSQQIAALSQQIQQLTGQLNTEQCNHSQTQAEMKLCHNELSNTQNELKLKLEQLETLKLQLKNISSKNEDLEKKLKQKEMMEANLRDEIDALQSELTLLKENNESLLEERQQLDEALQGKLLSKEKTASDLETKNKTLKSEMTAKNKQIKELEKEIRSLKSKLTSENKALGNKNVEITKLKSDLEAEMSCKTELESKIKELEEYVEKIQEDLKAAEKIATESKKHAAKCQSEKEQMFSQCEGQRTEMSSIMQGYKTDLDKNLSKKEKEVETLKNKIETMKTKHKKEVDDKVSKLNSEIEQLRKTISDSGYQMESLQKNFSEKENKVQELEKENLQKDEELKGLQEELGKMYIKSTTTSVVQTSPFPDKTYQKQGGSKIPTPVVPPRTPQIMPTVSSSILKTPALLKTPQTLRTPSSVKTPQRSILKQLSGNSASKKRRVVFASKADDENSESGESSSFEVMDIEDGRNGKTCTTPLILKHSPKPTTPRMDSNKKNSSIPLSRTPRGPPVDLSKKKKTKLKENDINMMADDEEMPLIVADKVKDKKEKPSSVRKAPNKSAGKFFKSSPKQRKDVKNTDMSWFENDDIFGFALED